MKTGNINVQTENIFPIIKKFLYSDHEIFLRELVSNAVDATQKLKTLKTVGELKTDLTCKITPPAVHQDDTSSTLSFACLNPKDKKLSNTSGS